MPLAGTQLTIQQAADYARQAGWSGPALIMSPTQKTSASGTGAIPSLHVLTQSNV